MERETRYTVFAQFERIAAGSLADAVRAAKQRFDTRPEDRVLVFDTETGRNIDFDLSGELEEAVARETERRERRGRGRPKLGVDCGEICLLPRHWEWLSAQPRSASATIRRLIDAARKNETPEDRARERIDAAGAFMWSMAGDLSDFEEASRALYAQDWQELAGKIASWPEDVREQVWQLLGEVADRPSTT